MVGLTESDRQYIKLDFWEIPRLLFVYLLSGNLLFNGREVISCIFQKFQHGEVELSHYRNNPSVSLSSRNQKLSVPVSKGEAGDKSDVRADATERSAHAARPRRPPQKGEETATMRAKWGLSAGLGLGRLR